MTPGGSGVVDDRPGAVERLLGHVEVVFALMRREVQSRFGYTAIGYAWTYVTPLAWIGGTYLAFYFFGRSSPVYTDIITFIISGLIPYAAFRFVINAVSRVPGSTRGLLIFPSVSVEHGVASMGLIEYVNIYIIFMIVAAANYLAFGNGELADPLMFVEGLTLAWALGLAWAYLFVVLSRFNPTFLSVSPVLLRPTFFISGVFFTANELPERVLSLFRLNPLLHAIEIARDGMLFHYESRIASPIYVVAWIAMLLFAALVIRSVQRG